MNHGRINFGPNTVYGPLGIHSNFNDKHRQKERLRLSQTTGITPDVIENCQYDEALKYAHKCIYGAWLQRGDNESSSSTIYYSEIVDFLVENVPLFVLLSIPDDEIKNIIGTLTAFGIVSDEEKKEAQKLLKSLIDVDSSVVEDIKKYTEDIGALTYEERFVLERIKAHMIKHKTEGKKMYDLFKSLVTILKEERNINELYIYIYSIIYNLDDKTSPESQALMRLLEYSKEYPVEEQKLYNVRDFTTDEVSQKVNGLVSSEGEKEIS